jgi:hypothetical protein
MKIFVPPAPEAPDDALETEGEAESEALFDDAAPVGPQPEIASAHPREFLAMRALQKKAQARARRARLTVLAVGAISATAALLAMPRWRSRIGAFESPAAEATPAVPAAAAPAVATVPAEAPAVAEPAAPAPVVAAIDPALTSACDTDFTRKQWKAAIASCGRAFEAGADARVAMKLAHAHWSHGQIPGAGKWAEQALALGTDDADAFVLIGHAERDAGHADAALAAYERYLRRAPAGWHAGRIRAAIRQLKAESN